jgi:hypothetical protein
MTTKDELTNAGSSARGIDTAPLPTVVDRATFQAQLDALLVREKAHTREGDAIAAARRRLPMVEVDPDIPLIGPHGPVRLVDVFERRRQMIAYYFMWHTGHPAPEQCEGCTWVTTQVAELSYLHSRHHLCGLLSGTVRGECPLPRVHGLGDTVVLSARLVSQCAACRSSAEHHVPDVLCSERRQGLRNLLDDTPRRRGHGLQLRTHGPDRVRTSGVVGGLALRLATAVHLYPDEERLADVAARVAGRTPDPPVAACASRTLRRPWQHVSLTVDRGAHYWQAHITAHDAIAL